ncbi:MAG: NUDIX hydrolase [Candidatus Daviesbacteria bacterium]|nr:NUDIX hydrolase [Candidatus Daviesbacteria bacterium]
MIPKNILVLVSGILIDSDEKILLLQRNNQNSSYQGYWQLPEGKIEFGEQSEEALKRELLEEIGVKNASVKLCDVSASLMYAKGKNYHVVRIVYNVRTRDKIVLGEDHSEFNWFSIKDAKLLEQKIDGLADILEKLF